MRLLDLRQDLRYTLRQMAEAPAFTAVAVLTLALAIGANTAIFSVVNAVLLRPLPYPHSDRLVVLWGARGEQQQFLLSVPDFADWRSQNHTFDDMGIVRTQSVNLTGTGSPDRLIGSFVTASTLDLFGARTARGRLFSPAETAVGTGQPVAVLSDATWRNRFGADPRIVGRTLVLNGRPHVVIGVTARDFRDPYGPAEVWLPITSAPAPSWLTREDPEVWAIGRLKPGVSVETAQRDLAAIAAELAALYPATNAGAGATVIGLQDSLVGNLRRFLVLVLAFVALVLLIACANVANLQLARATARRGEMQLRAALGAGRFRLLRQLLTESLVLAAMGGASGVVLARWAIRVLVAAVPGGLPVFGDSQEIGLDPRVLAFSAAVTLLAGLLFGAAPALHLAGGRLAGSLQARSADGATGRGLALHNTFVAAEIALSIVLLAGAGLLTRSLLELRRVAPGYTAEGVLTAEFRLPGTKYRTPEEIRQFMGQALSALRATPGIRSAALVQAVPLSGNWGRSAYLPEGAAVPAGQEPETQVNVASEGLFRTLEIPLLAGRDFDGGDRAGALPVAIVNPELARRAWPHGSAASAVSAVGRRLKLLGPPDEWVTVVGVAGTVKQRTLGEPAAAQLYRPLPQSPGIFTSVVARTAGDPETYAGALRAAIGSVDPDQPVWKVRSLGWLVARDIAPARFTMALSGSFALLALLLAVVGVYGVMAYAVSQRTREVGIRLALGARPEQVVRGVAGRGLRVIGIAAVLGLAAAMAAARLLRSQLYGVGPNDPLTFLAVAVGLAAVASLACYLPARRAARVDPAITLRGE
ncbi:MAG TPA: ABC transporter permease [Thermoanaerobaculia bacterium]|nr:ABC transporter permease [Thermoanaerobaculia bacterium]